MEKKKKILTAVLAIIAAAAGGSYAFDFSTNTTTNEGDTNINIEQRGEQFCELALISCEEDIIPEEYESACPVLDIICG